MHTNRWATVVLLTSGLMLGCEQHPVATAPQSPPAGASQTAPPAAATAPTVDTSLPSVESANAKPKTGTDATSDSTLTRTERDSKMPLPGQVNDHSSPAAAKRGDTTTPANTTK